MLSTLGEHERCDRNAGVMCRKRKLVLTCDGWPSLVIMIFSGQPLCRKVLPRYHALAFFNHLGGVMGIIIL